MPNVTSQQAAALRALDWLFSENEDQQGTGRTFVLAVAHLRRAVRTGRWVSVEDHHDSRGGDSGLLLLIGTVANTADIRIEVSGQHRFRVDRVTPASRQWLFEDFVEGPVQIASLDGAQPQVSVRSVFYESGRVVARAPAEASQPQREESRLPPPTMWERLLTDPT